MNELREQVRSRYAAAARGVGSDSGEQACCALDGCCGEAGAGEGAALYEVADRDALPDAAVLASLGCGNPLSVAQLNEGETVLDLGSGGGIDVLLSARRVGPSGKAFGLDMTEEMLALARENQAKAGVTNVEFLEGYIESIPLPAAVVDVIISNCVINLAADKKPVFAEMFRVLRPGGRIGITDIVSDDGLTPQERAERGSHVGCIAGALSFAEYRAGLHEAGFADIAVEPTHDVAPGMFSATVRATKPAEAHRK